MGVRDRLRKMFGPAEPKEIAAGEAAAGMTPASPFGPGAPINPYDGYNRVPRSRDFVTGYNIAARPRSQERIAFDTLRGLVEAYDVAQMCIWHRIDSIRALNWSLVPAPGFAGDADAAIALGKAALVKPDRQTPFSGWIAKYLYDVLAYDAGALYRMRNRRGDVVGLRVVDGTTIAPLLDDWGNRPEAPAPAYVQYAQGVPWNWVDSTHLIYEPFRTRSGTPYGLAPLETILLNANTDLRFQAHFLERFTEGNIPAALASAPDNWTPDQIEDWQRTWDAFMAGDQAMKSRIQWIPAGSKLAWSSEKDFTDDFSLFLMRKTCAAYHVVPADLGFTEDVNRSSGETQGDVQHRIGDLPLVGHLEGLLTEFLQLDMGLPVVFAYDTGQEKEDRLQLAQAWQIYVETGAASADEMREELLGLPGDPHRPTPRFFSTTRLGPVPLLAIDGVAGRTDPETFGPAQDQPVLPQPFVPPPGVVPAAGTTDAAASLAAEDAYQVQMRQQLQQDAARPALTKDGAPAAPAAGAPTAGITTATGITSYDLDGRHHPGEDDDQEQELVKAELAAFRRFRTARRRSRTWRDFQFRHLPEHTGTRLNQAGRAAVRKDAGEIAVAGLAVQAADTGRVLMIQRALDPGDPAAGMWEFPGGHLEDGEQPWFAALREWGEETGCHLPITPDGVSALLFGMTSGTGAAGWTHGIYQGFIYRVPSEDVVPITGDRDLVVNPDDPDGDQIEALAWWDPAQLADNPAVRPELLAALPDVLPALAATGAPAGVGGITKAGEPGPKGPGRAAEWPGWGLDEQCADHWAPLIAAALTGAVSSQHAEELAAAYVLARPGLTPEATKTELVDAATAWLGGRVTDLVTPLAGVLGGLHADARTVGAVSAAAVLDGGQPQLRGWTPGDTAAALAITAGPDLDEDEDLNDGDDIEETARATAVGLLKGAARALVDAVLAGAGVAAAGRALRDALGDADRARQAALTALTRGSSKAAAAVYRRRGVKRAAWVSDLVNPCPVCDMNVSSGPQPVGEPYPSGDAYPPAHPNCRCSLIPA